MAGGAELRDRLRWTWVRSSRRSDGFKDLVAAAESELAEGADPARVELQPLQSR